MSETADERIDRQLSELATVPWTCVQCGGHPGYHKTGCPIGHKEALDRVVKLEAEVARLEKLVKDERGSGDFDWRLAVSEGAVLKQRAAQAEAELAAMTLSRDGWQHDAGVYASNALKAQAELAKTHGMDPAAYWWGLYQQAVAEVPALKAAMREAWSQLYPGSDDRHDEWLANLPPQKNDTDDSA
jgi:hypothetical protein